jgi:adenine deaminase
MAREVVKTNAATRPCDGAERRRAIEVANGDHAPDLVVRGGTLANVYSGEWLPWNLEVADGRVAYAGPREPDLGPGTEVVDAAGLVVAPAYIEPHSHPWAIYNPVSLAMAGLARGTVTHVGENMLIAVEGPESLAPMLEAFAPLPAHLRWTARVDLGAAVADAQLRLPEVVGCMELARWRDICAGDPEVLAAYAAARERGKIVDGHAAGASFARLAALAAAGYSSDHEAITADQALDRLRMGLWTVLRGSSLRPDLAELARAMAAHGAGASRLLLTSDGSGPAHYEDRGMVDGLLATAVAAGFHPMTALRMATLNAATFLRLDHELGGLGPGRRATFVLLASPSEFTPLRVYADGRLVAQGGSPVATPPEVDWHGLGCSARFAAPERFAVPAIYAPRSLPGETVPAMDYESAVVTRRRDCELPADVDGRPAEGFTHVALIDRGCRRIVRGVATGLFRDMPGIASSYNAPMELLVAGRDPESMGAAAAEVARMGGGIAVAAGRRATWSARLVVLGMETSGTFAEAARIERELRERFAAAGYPHDDPLYTLLFAAADNIPDLKLSTRGLLEVKTGRLLGAPEPLPAA